MKQKILTVLVITFILSIMAIPVMANTSNWSFTMNYIVVDGSSNGVYHSMTAGSMSLNGTVWAYSKDGGANPSPGSIDVKVYEERDWWADRHVGTNSVTPSSILYDERSINGSYGQQSASNKYYLYIMKSSGNDDGWNIQGSGTLTTQ